VRRNSKPYRLCSTDDPNLTLGEGPIRHYGSMLEAANAFVRDPVPYKQVIYDDGCQARELNDCEQQQLEHVCGMLGYDLEEIEG
jgi:hypothetical protein